VGWGVGVGVGVGVAEATTVMDTFEVVAVVLTAQVGDGGVTPVNTNCSTSGPEPVLGVPLVAGGMVRVTVQGVP
jgi:hypothetical protein